MYTSASSHTDDCSEFIRGMYTDKVVSYLYMMYGINLFFRSIFVSEAYMAIPYELDIAFGCVLAHICKNVWSICPFNIMAVWLIFAMQQPYLLRDLCQICVW